MNQVSLSSSSFPSTFTLVGDTSGGPPTSYTWTRDGVNITNGESLSISLSLNKSNPRRFMDSLYVSTLTVTGRYPGVYGYSVTNRAQPTTGLLTDHFTIEGMYILLCTGFMVPTTSLTFNFLLRIMIFTHAVEKKNFLDFSNHTACMNGDDKSQMRTYSSGTRDACMLRPPGRCTAVPYIQKNICICTEPELASMESCIADII